MAVVSFLRDGAPNDSGHTHLVLDQDALLQFSGDGSATNDKEKAPGKAPVHGSNNATGTIVNTNANYQVSYKKYYSQLGAKDGLRDTIVTTTDLALMCALKYDIWEYKNHAPLELIRHTEK